LDPSLALVSADVGYGVAYLDEGVEVTSYRGIVSAIPQRTKSVNCPE